MRSGAPWVRNFGGHVTVRPPVHSQHSEFFSLCGSLHSDQSVLELDHRRPSYGQLTRTAVRISADQYHMTLSWSHVSTNRDHVFYYGFSLTIYKLLIDCKLKFHFFQQQLFLVC